MKNESQQTNWLQDFVRANLLTLLLGAALVWNGFQNADTETAHRLAAIERQLSVMQAKQDSRRDANVCALRTIDKLLDKTGTVPPCTATLGE